MNKIYLLISLVVIILSLLFIQNIDADDAKRYTLFEDGVTYIDRYGFGYKMTNIIHDGTEIKCHDYNGYGGSMNPRCLEIIMRSVNNASP